VAPQRPTDREGCAGGAAWATDDKWRRCDADIGVGGAARRQIDGDTKCAPPINRFRRPTFKFRQRAP